MLISFSVENFLSFRDKQTLDFSPEPLKEHPEYLHIPYLYDQNYRLLKSIALYGHNSHGKSNLIKSFVFFRNTIFSSFVFGKPEGVIQVDHFRLNRSYENKPSSFDITFLIRETKYRYRFALLHGKVLAEDLWYSESKIRENYLFERTEDDIKLSKAWSRESEKIVQSRLFTKSNNLFLSVLLSQENIPRIDEIGNWFKGNIILSDFAEDDHLKKAVLILASPEYRPLIKQFIQNADIGFTTITEKIDSQSANKLRLTRDFLNLLFHREIESFEIYTQHDIYDDDNKWVDHIMFELLKSESSGSIKYLILSCYLAFAIKNGQLLLVDEIDSKLHVLLLKNIIKVYNGGKTNVFGSQLIYSTHNTALMNNTLFRRDQIHFITKQPQGQSVIQRLHTGKSPIRKGTSLEKIYLSGQLKAGISQKLKEDPNNLFDFLGDPNNT